METRSALPPLSLLVTTRSVKESSSRRSEGRGDEDPGLPSHIIFLKTILLLLSSLISCFLPLRVEQENQVLESYELASKKVPSCIKRSFPLRRDFHFDSMTNAPDLGHAALSLKLHLRFDLCRKANLYCLLMHFPSKEKRRQSSRSSSLCVRAGRASLQTNSLPINQSRVSPAFRG